MDNTKLAEAFKKKGNEFYKKRDFVNALICYEKASELIPTNPIFLTNQSAVYFETGDYRKCIECCTRAEKHLDSLSDQQKIAMYTRMYRASFFVKDYSTVTKIHEKLLQLQVNLDNIMQEIYKISKERLVHPNKLPEKTFHSTPNRPSLHPHRKQIIGNEEPLSLLQSIFFEGEPQNLKVKTLTDHGQLDFHLLFVSAEDPRHLLQTCVDIALQTDLDKIVPGADAPKDVKKFEKIEIHLNEKSPEKISKTILLLFLLKNAPQSNIDHFHKIYTIWQSINLVKEDKEFLNETLEELIELASTGKWGNDDRTKWIILREEDLQILIQIWKKWKNCDTKLHELLKQIKPFSENERRLLILKSDLAKQKGKKFKKEYDFYIETKCILPNENEPKTDEIANWLANPTLIIDDKLKKEGYNQVAFPPDTLVTNLNQIYLQLDSYALGTSSVLMLQSLALSILSNLKIHIHLSDELLLAEHFAKTKMLFDRIHTSHLIDEIGLLNILVHYSPLLKNSPFGCIHFHLTLSHDYLSTNHFLWNTIKLKSENELQRAFGLRVFDGDLGSYFRFAPCMPDYETKQQFIVANKLMSKSELFEWLSNLYMAIVYPPKRENKIKEPSSFNLTSFLKLLEILVSKNYPLHYLNEFLENILYKKKVTALESKMEIEEIPKMVKKNIGNVGVFKAELMTLLVFSIFGNTIAYPFPKEFIQLVGTIEFIDDVKNTDRGFLELIFTKNGNIENENLRESLKTFDEEIQVFSNFEFTNNEVKIWIPRLLLDDKKGFFVLLNMDKYEIISKPIPISQFKVVNEIKI